MIFDVTHICTLRLQHVVVAMTAQQMRGRFVCSRTVSVRCVAGQHIATSRRVRCLVQIKFECTVTL